MTEMNLYANYKTSKKKKKKTTTHKKPHTDAIHPYFQQKLLRERDVWAVLLLEFGDASVTLNVTSYRRH